MPASWQYSEDACTKITVDTKEFKTDNCAPTKWVQTADIFVRGLKEGTIEVSYLVEKPIADEGPFLWEERDLLEGLARILGDFIARKQARDELLNAYHELKSLEELKKNIIANVSHELRTPITIATTALELAGEEENSIERVLLLDLAGKALHRQDRIVGDMIQASIFEKGHTKLIFETVDLRWLINKVLSELESEIKVKQLTVKTDINEDLSPVSVDVEQILRVLRNLLRNAVKFNNAKGKIMLHAVNKKAFVEVSVEDSGIGISKSEHEKIFNVLYQIDSSSSREYGGIGLGLAVSKKIIHAHGGKLAVESKVGSGSKFTFTIPKAKEE